ncbi:MAG: CsgG/HfaB family protein [Candidatus Moraniibacteriota bacterium]
MKNSVWFTRFAIVLALGFLATGCTSLTVVKEPPTEYVGEKVVSGLSLIEQLKQGASNANPSIVLMVGDCTDKTGKFLDAEQVRYSRAVTQACADLLINYARLAGFKVAERSPFNLGLIAQEYKLSHEFLAPSKQQSSDMVQQTVPKNIGLIQKGGPNGGLTGANYMLTGAISMYASSVATGGGGADVDAIGFSVKGSTARVGIILRIVDISTGLVMSSLALETAVVGKSAGFHITRFIGDVTSIVATAVGGVATATSAAHNHVISGEVGGATQLPIDYAVMDVLVASLMRQLEANQQFFYVKPVTFDYTVPTQ